MAVSICNEIIPQNIFFTINDITAIYECIISRANQTLKTTLNQFQISLHSDHDVLRNLYVIQIADLKNTQVSR